MCHCYSFPIFTRHDPSDIITLILHFDLGEIMRCLSLALVFGMSAVAFAQTAVAGDMGRPVYEPLPPPPPAVADWSGVYVGVESGYGAGHQSFDPAFNSPSQVSPTGSSVPQSLGGFAGAQKQLGDSVLGVETDIQHR
jgi:opacity protein-like surface antigen